jgi:hypothetical protein
MIDVFKCDFCTHFTQDAEEMRIHEQKCSFNPINKKCFTCKYAWDSGFDCSIPECEKNISTLVGRDQGNCIGWEKE